eukprot:763899-Hanusia_phi.AAC.3
MLVSEMLVDLDEAIELINLGRRQFLLLPSLSSCSTSPSLSPSLPSSSQPSSPPASLLPISFSVFAQRSSFSTSSPHRSMGGLAASQAPAAHPNRHVSVDLARMRSLAQDSMNDWRDERKRTGSRKKRRRKSGTREEEGIGRKGGMTGGRASFRTFLLVRTSRWARGL